jgi:hypothetical protein
MKNLNLLQLALNEKGEIVSIYNVPTGIACNCFCPTNPTQPLVAKNKNKSIGQTLNYNQKAAHFALPKGGLNIGAAETAIHLLTKEVLRKHKKIRLPSIMHLSAVLTKPILVEFEKCEPEVAIESPLGVLQPDIIASKRNQKLLVEFYKTHKVDLEKEKKIISIETSCLEINLEGLPALNIDGNPNEEGIIKLLESGLQSRWIFNTKKDELIEKHEKQRKVDLDEKIKQQLILQEKENRAQKKMDEKRASSLKRWEDYQAALRNSGFDVIMSMRNVSRFNVFEYIECPKNAAFFKNDGITNMDKCRNCKWNLGDIKYNNIVCGWKGRKTEDDYLNFKEAR